MWVSGTCRHVGHQEVEDHPESGKADRQEHLAGRSPGSQRHLARLASPRLLAAKPLHRIIPACIAYSLVCLVLGASETTSIENAVPVKRLQNRGACTACRTTGPPPPGVQGAAEFARPAQPAAPEPKPVLHGLAQPQRAPSASPQAAARPPPAAVKPVPVLEQGVSVPISAEAPKVLSRHCTLKVIREFPASS